MMENFNSVITKKVFLEVGEPSRLFMLLNFLEILKDEIKFIHGLNENDCHEKYFIPVKIPFIEALADPDCITNQEVVNAYRQSNAKILFDLSTESITFSDYTSEILLTFHQILRHADIDPGRIYLICANSHAEEHYPEWNSQHGLEDYQIKMLGYNFIHVGAPHLLAFLRSKGFQTFSPYIDESYDNIEEPAERLEAIFKEIDRLCAMSLDDIHDLYCKLWPRLLHNFYHFQNCTKEIAKAEINNILEKIV
ncbi:MAG: hypothetical protein C4526_04040 [Nitrospiraceae bacterium]|nr:MAG: hypothetical protein C4526_04040 [Nitrospiraceae bacterium]